MTVSAAPASAQAARARRVATIPNLISLVRLLCDPDLDVRILGAAVTLERFGPAAAAAVPDLIKWVNNGDPDNRIAVMKTLVAMFSSGMEE